MNKTFCHIVFERYSEDGRVRRYCNFLLENNYHVFVISLKGHGEKVFERIGNLSIYRIPITKKRTSLIRRIYEYLLFEILAFIISSWLFFYYGVNKFHIHTLPDFLVFSAIIPKFFGSKIILDFHELFPEFFLQLKGISNTSSLIYKLVVMQEKVSFRCADKIISIHEPAKKILAQRNGKPDRITVIMNSFANYEIRKIKKYKTQNFRIIYNGVINYNLDLNNVIRALSLIQKDQKNIYQDIEFHLYGNGPDLQNLISLAEELNIDNLIYHGKISMERMHVELSKASALILPPNRNIYSELYYSEKLIEAINYQIPVIISRLKTYLWHYSENCLFYFKPGNVVEIADRIIEVYNNKENIIGIKAENAINQYQKFSWSIMKERYRKVIKNI